MKALIKKALSLPSFFLNYCQLKYFKVEFEDFPRIKGCLVLGGQGKLIFGKQVVINSSQRSNPVGGAIRTSIHFGENAVVEIGDNVGISNATIYSVKSILIQNNVMIGGGCQIYDTDFHSLQYEDRIINGDNNVKIAPVVIGQGAFLGASSIILKGVTIGEKSIIAAGSVVTKSIPDGEIWGGNPAKFIRKL